MATEPLITMIEPPQWMMRVGVQHIMHAFVQAKIPFHFVGGAVRDTIRGVPVHDIDACTAATPDEMMVLLNDANIKTIPIGIDHGTILAVYQGEKVEITTLRVDDVTDGRHAEVSFTGNLEGDALRRDFTMNALMLAPDGTLTDYVGAVADIKAEIVRFIGEPAKRIEEDYLRILRYARFIATTGWQHVDIAALQACKNAIGKLSSLSAERIQQEIMKLLGAGDPRYGLSLLEDMGAAPLLFHCNKLTAPYSPHCHALLRLCLILRAQHVLADTIALGWKLSKADSTLLTTLCLADTQPPLHLLQEHGEEVATLIAHRAQAEEDYDMNSFKMTRKTWEKKDFPISGNDVMDTGVEAGEKLGKILAQLKDEWKQSEYSLSKSDLLKKL